MSNDWHDKEDIDEFFPPTEKIDRDTTDRIDMRRFEPQDEVPVPVRDVTPRTKSAGDRFAEIATGMILYPILVIIGLMILGLGIRGIAWAFGFGW